MAKIDNLSKYEDNEPIIWSDRKRILGMPISFTKYSFDHNKFYVKKGLFNISHDSILLYRVLDIRLTRSFWQRIFGVGSVTLVSADSSTPNLEVRNIKDSERVRSALSNIVEQERDEKRVLGKEMFGASGMFDLEGVEHPIDTL